MTGHAATVREALDMAHGFTAMDDELNAVVVSALAALDALVAELADLDAWRAIAERQTRHTDAAVLMVSKLEAEIERLTLPNIARDQLPMLFTQMKARAEEAEGNAGGI